MGDSSKQKSRSRDRSDSQRNKNRGSKRFASSSRTFDVPARRENLCSMDKKKKSMRSGRPSSNVSSRSSSDSSRIEARDKFKREKLLESSKTCRESRKPFRREDRNSKLSRSHDRSKETCRGGNHEIRRSRSINRFRDNDEKEYKNRDGSRFKERFTKNWTDQRQYQVRSYNRPNHSGGLTREYNYGYHSTKIRLQEERNHNSKFTYRNFDHKSRYKDARIANTLQNDDECKTVRYWSSVDTKPQRNSTDRTMDYKNLRESNVSKPKVKSTEQIRRSRDKSSSARKKNDRKQKNRSSSSGSSSSSSSATSEDEKERKKQKRKAEKLKKTAKKHWKKEKRLKKKLTKKKLKSDANDAKVQKNLDREEKKVSDHGSQDRLLEDISVEVTERAKAMAPMTKEEWEKKQSVIRRIYDEETGRHRLVKGDGEILEEIVRRDRHMEINRQATRGDGEYFQAKLRLKK